MNKNVIITGATGGLGEALAKTFAGNHYNLILTYCNNELKALELKKELEAKYKISVDFYKLDLALESNINDVCNQIINKYDNIDCLINNAAIAIDNEIEKKSGNEFTKVVNVNLIGTFLMMKNISKLMLKNKCGCIINIASTNGIDTQNTYSMDYDASKAGIISLTYNFADLLAPDIRVNVIAPGWINTQPVLEMDPNIIKEEQDKILLNRFADPIEVADVALFLASNKASYINKSIIRIDGGKKC